MEILRERITELLFENVSTQEQMILLYLEKHIDDLPNQSLAKIADNNFCSTTSVTRLIKKLGYSSLKELQLALNLSSIPKAKQPDDLEYIEFLKYLNRDNCIYVYGKGASQITSLYIFRQLIKNGYDASRIDEQDLLYSLNNKTVLCISNSGETNTVYKVMEDIKELNDCIILSITKQDSTLDKLSTCSITHNRQIYGKREDQLHMLEIANQIVSYL